MSLILFVLYIGMLALSTKFYYRKYDFFHQFYCELSEPHPDNNRAIICYLISGAFMIVYFFSLGLTLFIPYLSYQILFDIFILISMMSYLCMVVYIFEFYPRLHVFFSILFMIGKVGTYIIIACFTQNPILILYIMICFIALGETLFAFREKTRYTRLQKQIKVQKIQSIFWFILIPLFHILY